MHRLSLLSAVVVAGVVVLAGPAAPAFADLPSGSGYSASWDYYTGTSYRYSATLPGIRLTGYGTDTNGNRSTLGTIVDVVADSRCGRVQLYGGSTLLVDKTVCGNGTSVAYNSSSFNGALTIVFLRLVNGTATVDRSYTFTIPSSTSDPQLRTVGTGASWTYDDDHSYTARLVRPGVTMDAHGAHQEWEDQRSMHATLRAERGRCTSGLVKGTNRQLADTVCNGGFVSLSDWFYEGWILLKACDTGQWISAGTPWPPPPAECISIQVPVPR
jgi:hypothetical protein